MQDLFFVSMFYSINLEVRAQKIQDITMKDEGSPRTPVSHCSSDLHYSLLRKRNEFVDLPDFKIHLLDFVIAF